MNPSIVQGTKKSQFISDSSRNINSLNKFTNDYGKSSVNLTQLERNTTSQQHILNINKSSYGSKKMSYDDNVKTTIKETTVGLVDTNRNYRPSVVNGDSNSGFTDWDPKSTQKESTVYNKYVRPIAKNDGMGYAIANYDARATIKQTTLNQNHLNNASFFVNDHMDYTSSKDPQKIRYATHAENYNGTSSFFVNDHMDYTASKDPQKIRYAVHAKDYQGPSTFFKSDSENRDKYYNADISDRKEQIIYKAPGQEFRGANSNVGKICAGEGLVGYIKSTDNMLFKERHNFRHVDNVGNINNIIPTVTQLGKTTQQEFHNRNSQVDVFNSINLESPNNRFNSDLITQQLSQNPFYNLKRNI